ncbi:carboxyl transferase domain-containing protein [Entomospira culicis]|uniref:ATP-grasp domain-containing protein n=1 Tax=Entomospira culicis TaxID=2719989 RepID=A0A968GEV1_9SPIO|nr:carboxyl transferase domain-containing protein [Entomospira culicis]NIZ18752.1 ATP-grasp domain-containing protein [Entomospira culicis]NIZ68967.1 ATP-grasp domain-containing protein [Entomospira culicis]WDI37559.1 carboxyl transferase domain-containing protein [Entomospira culicis]WDI39187.1 carboxyl transferase domain-containing protein [Entomospira culicis]
MRPVLEDGALIGIINRGEAAMRFIRALKEYNLKHKTNFSSVAFYIDEEEQALFVQEADYAYPLSSFSQEPVAESAYISHELLLYALTKSGCNAVWAGWGFVSEDTIFVSKLEQADLIFLGPSSASMSSLGDKINSKALAVHSNVAVTPWSGESITSLEHAKEWADKIGYPVILKASNAGGGRGIRFVWQASDLADAYHSAREETIRFTGTDILFMERLVATARHFEVQAIGDYHGNVKTFGVRDCSVQRRNQKIIEETPPINVDPDVLLEMEASAKRLLEQAKYEGAGTVEFIYDVERQAAYFMEVNARLQVEHPITEELYQIDLVAAQIDIAQGKSIAHYDRTPYGHVMELRLNAEDAMQEFKPAPGFVRYFKPAAGLGVRVDSSIATGSTISSKFDSMVAKIIVRASDRSEAIARLKRAIEETFIAIKGGTTNRLFALELLNHPKVIAGGVSTRFVEEYLSQRTISMDYAVHALLVVAAETYLLREEREEQIFVQEVRSLGQPRDVKLFKEQSIVLTLAQQRYQLEVRALWANLFVVRYNNQQYLYTYQREAHQRALLGFAGDSMTVQVSASGMLWRIELGQSSYLVDSDSYGMIAAASPGVVLSLAVEVGSLVRSGDLLLYMEAMKMEMPVYASVDGVVSSIKVDVGQQVMAGAILMKIEEQSQGEAQTQTVKSDIFAGLFGEMPLDELEVQALMSGYVASPSIIHAVTAESEILASALPFYVMTHQLFSHEPISDSNAISYREGFLRLLRGLPLSEATEELQALMTCLASLYGKRYQKLERAEILGLGYRLYQAYARKAEQEKVLQYLFVHVKDINLNDRFMVDDLQAIVKMHNSLSVVAQDFIYHHFTTQELKALASDKVVRFQRVFEMMSQYPRHKDELMPLAMKYGPVSEMELFARIDGGIFEHLGMEILANRLFLGRAMVVGFYRPNYFEFTYQDYDAHAVRASMIAYQSMERDAQLLLESQAEHLLLICHAHTAQSLAQVLEHLEAKASTSLVRITFLSTEAGAMGLRYQHYYRTPEGWQIDPIYLDFNLFHFHQLRLYRLAPFALKHQKLSSTMGLILAQAHEQAKDERFILYMSVEALRPIMGERVHLLGLEESLSEGVFALRQAQLQRKKRLYWNRILIFVQQPIDALMEEIGQYSLDLTQKLLDTELGIERVSVYITHLNGEQEELTLTPSGSIQQMSLVRRVPKTEPLKLQNHYDSKVMRAHARGLFYPYELIKFLENGDFGLPKARFVEYDLVDDASFRLQVVERDIALNRANVVVGSIEQESQGVLYQRMMILSDATQDMGSLAEPEARRVIAVLDMASELGLPVEWLPLSSGAKITLDSGTENLDWTAAVLRRIIEFTQAGGEINIIVSGINVGAQSYWNAEATMLMHTRGLLIMTDMGSMLLTGKRALDFAGAVSASDNLGIGGAQAIMLPNGEAQIYAPTLKEAYHILLRHYATFYAKQGEKVAKLVSDDPATRDIGLMPYEDAFEAGFQKIDDIFSEDLNGERKKPFSMRQVMRALCDQDSEPLERMAMMANAQGVVVWQSRIGGYACGLIGIESHPQARHGQISGDGPATYSGGTLYPLGSNKLARAVNIFSDRLPLVILANLSGFDGSPESLRLRQLEWGAEIGRAMVNFKGPILFVVTSRYHGGAYVVFSKMLNSQITTYALSGAFASVIGGAPAAAVVFPALVAKRTLADERWQRAHREKQLDSRQMSDLYQEIYLEKQQELAVEFDQTHNIERAKSVGSIDKIIELAGLRPSVVQFLQDFYQK